MSARACAGRGPVRLHGRGLGLLSAMLTLSVLLALALGAFQTYQRLNGDYRGAVLATLLEAVETSVRRAFSDADEFPELGAVQTAALVGAQLRLKGGALVTPWGGEITAFAGDDVTRSTANAAAHADRFVVRVEGVPERACETVVVALLAREYVTAVHVGSVLVTDLDAVLASCGASNDLAIVFRR